MVQVSTTPLLKTKLFLPRARGGTICRPRLYQRLDQGMERKLTLCSAPAGFGKTTLVAAWREQGAHPMGWVSLDASDNDPVQFWSYLVAAVESIHPPAAQDAAALLRTGSSPAVETAILALLNGMAEVAFDFALALDDYHLIETPAIHQGMTLLLERLPPRCHLLLLTRADPPLPLARLRAQQELVEVRARELRFREEEAGQLLGDMSLSADDLAALTARTEGWVAGLQLAALSIQSRENVAEFMADLLGTNRYIVDYLVEEVLRRLPDEQQGFLLATSVLDRLCGPLCDAVTGQTGSQGRLEALEQANLFTVALDDERRWFRYHHLFASVLQARLRQQWPERVAELHRRAADWYEANEMLVEATHAAVAAADFDRAATLAERVSEELGFRGEHVTLTNLIEAIPVAVVNERPRLILMQVAALVSVGQADAGERHLRAGEVTLLRACSGEDAAARALRGRWLALESTIARLRGDASTVSLVREALVYLPEEDYRWRGLMLMNLGILLLTTGELTEAEEALRKGTDLTLRHGHHYLLVNFTCTHGLCLEVLGRLDEADAAYRSVLDVVGAAEVQPPNGGWCYVGQARIRYERDHVEEAERLLLQGLARGERTGNLDVLSRGLMLLLQMRHEQGDLEGARAALSKLAALVEPIPGPMARSMMALARLRLDVAEGRLEQAERLLADAPFPGPEPTTIARLYIALGRPEAVIDRLDESARAALEAGHGGTAIWNLVALAMAQRAAGGQTAAVESLSRAVALAEPSGYVRTFVSEGAPMAELLRRVRVHPEYVERLLGALGVEPAPPVESGALVERLTERELEVLRLVAEGLSSEEIAERAFITPGTLKRHLHNILGKLGAGNRREAVRKARELKLL